MHRSGVECPAAVAALRRRSRQWRPRAETPAAPTTQPTEAPPPARDQPISDVMSGRASRGARRAEPAGPARPLLPARRPEHPPPGRDRIRPELTGLLGAVVVQPRPRSALIWLRKPASTGCSPAWPAGGSSSPTPPSRLTPLRGRQCPAGTAGAARGAAAGRPDDCAVPELAGFEATGLLPRGRQAARLVRPLTPPAPDARAARAGTPADRVGDRGRPSRAGSADGLRHRHCDRPSGLRTVPTRATRRTAIGWN